MGTPYTIGERVFDVPRLRVGTYRRATEILAELPEDSDVKGAEVKPEVLLRWFEGHCKAIRELLLRGYPDLSVSEVEDLVDMDAVQATFLGVMAAAGKRPDAPGEAKGP